ncbi:hypothetical protein SDJN03_16240, partial [Cucurbita argyrosperma subsp. sororia]
MILKMLMISIETLETEECVSIRIADNEHERVFLPLMMLKIWIRNAAGDDSDDVDEPRPKCSERSGPGERQFGKGWRAGIGVHWRHLNSSSPPFCTLNAEFLLTQHNISFVQPCPQPGQINFLDKNSLCPTDNKGVTLKGQMFLGTAQPPFMASAIRNP